MNNGLYDLSTPTALAGQLRAWVRFRGTDGKILTSWNVRKVTRDAAGQYTIDLDMAFPSSEYCIIGTAQTDGTTFPFVCIRAGNGTAHQKLVRVQGVTAVPASAAFDATEVHVAFYGNPPSK